MLEKAAWLRVPDVFRENPRLAIGALMVTTLAVGTFAMPVGDGLVDAEDAALHKTDIAAQQMEARGLSAASRSIGGRNDLPAVEVVGLDFQDQYQDPNLPATTLSANGIELIKQFEGFSHTGYLLGDGKCTIGWGHTVPVAERPDCLDWEITVEEAHEFIADHVTYFEEAVNSFFTRDFNQNQFDALVSFAYNVGEPWFKWDWPTDPDDQFFEDVLPLYVYPAQFTEGLAKRRAAEVELFNTPVG
ncbi:MAG: lysozyme [Promicromonosporaceae bacterium]|nr:lysozyme [Promicromonosporaceae bacterium]